MPENQKQGIRSFIIQLVIKLSDDEQMSQQQLHLLTKLNATLISIVKQEWTTSWKNFIPDICLNARESQSKCENVLNILKLLSEEVFDFSKNAMLSQQAKELKDTMVQDFSTIFELCKWVLDQACANPQGIKISLIRACLKTFQAFLSWIPYGYIFDTPLIPMIINNFISPAQTRNEAIRCMTEIAQLTFEDLEEQERLVNKEKICMYFCLFIQKIAEVTKGRSLLDEFKSVVNSKNQSGFETFAKQLALSISAVLKSNIDLIEHTTNSMEQNQNILFLQQCVQESLTFLT
jgi:exportin-1